MDSEHTNTMRLIVRNVCDQYRFRSACAYELCDQALSCLPSSQTITTNSSSMEQDKSHPTYNKSTVDEFEIILSEPWKEFINESMITE